MKKLFTLLALVITLITFAQAPQGFNYQATVRNSSGALIVNQNVNFKFNIMLNSATSLPVFSETHMAPTDDLGQVNLVIGQGTATTGTFSTINWGSGNYFLGIELNTGSGYVAMGTTQLLSVPYALYANSSGNAQAATPNLASVLAVNNGANNLKITNLANPTDAQDATNKVYVDSKVPNGILPGDIMMWNGTNWDLSSNLLPKINTIQASLITSNSCQVGGEIISIGGSNIIRKGICYSEQIFPTVADTRVYNTSTNNTYSLNITLAPDMTYYVRSFAENSFGITYGQEITLTTLQALPSLTTTAVTSISNISAISGGNITNEGGGVITSRGIVWATTANPTTTSYLGITTDGTSTGTFSSNLTGLTPFTLYYVRAYATNSLGTAYGNEFSFTTQSIPSFPTGTIFCNNVITGVIDVTNPTTGKTWMDRNLGASQVATSSTDALAYGDLYQWGRSADGHQCRNSNTTTMLSSSDQPSNSNFIVAPTSPFDWRSPQNTNLWQGVSGLNNPCPIGYRLPTEIEFNAEALSWSSQNSAGAFASPLKLSMAGYRYLYDGSINSVGTGGSYWSSTISDTRSRGLGFVIGSSANIMNYYNRGSGASVRCIKN